MSIPVKLATYIRIRELWYKSPELSRIREAPKAYTMIYLTEPLRMLASIDFNSHRFASVSHALSSGPA